MSYSTVAVSKLLQHACDSAYEIVVDHTTCDYDRIIQYFDANGNVLDPPVCTIKTDNPATFAALLTTITTKQPSWLFGTRIDVAAGATVGPLNPPAAVNAVAVPADIQIGKNFWVAVKGDSDVQVTMSNSNANYDYIVPCNGTFVIQLDHCEDGITDIQLENLDAADVKVYYGWGSAPEIEF